MERGYKLFVSIILRLNLRLKASGTRTEELSLRQQRFTLPMLNSLRTDDIRIDLSLSESMNELNNCSVTIPNSYVGVMARVKNLRRKCFGAVCID